jgi:drug/metabolite transporter (DMT)-like permease
MSPEAVGATLVCILVCGFLAALGGALDRRLGSASQKSQAAVFVVWQTGAALMLGLLLRVWRRRSLLASASRLRRNYPPRIYS